MLTCYYFWNLLKWIQGFNSCFFFLLFNFQGPFCFASLEVTALLVYHSRHQLSTPFLKLFSLFAPLPCVSSSPPHFFSLIYALFSGFDYLFFCFILYKNDLVFIKNPSFSCFYFDFFRFFLLEFKKYFVILFIVFCARSSVDRAPASGAGCVGSIPVGRASKKKSRPNGLLFLYYIHITFP